MNPQHIFRSMFWKDYRELRAFWLATVLLAVILESCVTAFWARSEPTGFPLRDTIAWAILFSSVYALGCAAAMFAGEHESGTFALLETLPTEPLRLLASRAAFVATSTGLMFLALSGFGSLVATQEILRPQPIGLVSLFGQIGLLPVELFVWGLLFSLVCRRALVAAALAGVVGAGSLSMIILVLSDLLFPERWWPVALPVRMAVIVLVGLLDAWLVARWLCPEKSRLRRWERQTDQPAALPAEIPAWRRRWRSASRECGRLIWHEWHQSWRVLAGLGVTMVPAMTVGCVLIEHSQPDPDDVVRLIAALLLLCPTLLGACTFQGDWRQNRFRFLADHGARPGCMWLSRQVVWVSPSGIVVLILVLILLLVAVTASLVSKGPPFGELCAVIGLVIFVPLAAHACGQFCSLHLRSSLLAGLASVILLGVLFCAGAVVLALRVASPLDLNGFLSLAAVAILLLTATRLRIRDWMLERTGWRVRTKAVLIPVVPVLVLLIVLPFHRMYSVPTGGPGFDVDEFTRPSTPEDQETARTYEEAWTSVATRTKHNDFRGLTGWSWDDAHNLTFESSPLSDVEIAWLQANPRAIELAVRAAERQTRAVLDPIPGLDGPDPSSRIAILAHLVACSARQLMLQGKLDTASDHYIAAMRISIQSYGASSRWVSIDELSGKLAAGLALWAAHPNQTPARIERALHEVARLETLVPSAEDRIKAKYLCDENWLSAAGRSEIRLRGHRWEEAIQLTALKWLPWERVRAQRAINCLAQHNLAVARQVDEALGGNRRVAEPSEEPRTDVLRATESLPGVSPYEWAAQAVMVVPDATRRRALRLQLALAAWRREHGEVPKTLDELLGKYLDAVPIDPYTGKPFRYFPEGLRWAVTASEIGPAGMGRDGPDHVGACIWSPMWFFPNAVVSDQDTPSRDEGRFFPVP